MKLLKLLFMMLVYFSIGTVVAEAGIITALWLKGRLTAERGYQLLAVAHDVDLYSMWKKMEAASRPIDRAQVSYQELVDARQAVSLDLDVRELGVNKGLHDMRHLQTSLGKERQRYERLREEFEQKLEQLRQGAVDQALLDVQRQLEVVSPQLAKDQIIRIMDDPSVGAEKGLQFVVTMIKAMPLDRRKKILSEFKTPQDAERMHAILRQIRLGVPDVQLIRETRDELQQFISKK